MPVYMVHVDLAKSSSNLPEIDMALETLDNCVRPVPFTWFVEGAVSAGQIGQLLEPFLSGEDTLLVARAGQEGFWRRVDPGAEEWMSSYFKRDQ